MNQSEKNLKFFRISELSSILGISRATIHREIKAKRLNPTLVGKRIRFTLEDIHKYLIICNTKEEEGASSSSL